MYLNQELSGANPYKAMSICYTTVFYSMLVITAALAWLSRPAGNASTTEARRLKWRYLTAWYFCVAGDWLQGPYVYMLYQSYGFERAQISQLFVAGFGASMVFGTVVGALGDKIGRRRNCQLYCILYVLSCCTKHFSEYWVLMVGRITGGIATSVLFSGFESWLVAESATCLQADESELGHVFALMWYGSSLIAILAGVVGDAAVAIHPLVRTGYAGFAYGGYISAFDLSSVVLAIGFAVVSLSWGENFGTANAEQQRFVPQVQRAVSVVAGSHRLVALVLVVGCFEGSMYSFVINWTPALQNDVSKPPVGRVFASFMMACMCGSSLVDILLRSGWPVRPVATCACGLGALALTVATVALWSGETVPGTAKLFLGFVVFEFCVGLYFPATSVLKRSLVIEEIRSTVYNLFRVPLNAIVITLVLVNPSILVVMGVCSILLAVACLATISLGVDHQNSCCEGGETYGSAD